MAAPIQFNDVISDEEIFRCPIQEDVRVLDLYFALQILKMDVYALDKSFLSGLHKELVNHMLQRGTMAEKVLFTPNICAELFTLKEFETNQRYIVNKLIGRRDLDGQRIEDFDVIYRQAYRKIIKLSDERKDGFLIFFWNREPNLIREINNGRWVFYTKSPAYKALVDFYGRYKPIEEDC